MWYVLSFNVKTVFFLYTLFMTLSHISLQASEVVRSCADSAFTKAVNQAKVLLDYSQAGEVCNVFFFLPSISYLNTSDSGLLLMLAMIQLRMRTTLQFHVYTKGNVFFNMFHY